MEEVDPYVHGAMTWKWTRDPLLGLRNQQLRTSAAVGEVGEEEAGFQTA